VSDGPGLTAVRMGTAAGDIAITRPDGLLASYAVPGQPERLVALKRRSFTELLSEELRRMDPDQVYEHTVKSLLDGESKKTTSGRAAKKGTPKKGTAKRGTAKGAERARTAAKKTTTTAGSR
jgi:glucose-6-phosphate dehydrogenase assembly protein OpcA